MQTAGDNRVARAHAGGRAETLTALFLVGLGTFLNFYATQPLLPEFRRLFRASELLVSLTVSGPVIGMALTAPFVGLLSDAIGRKRVIVGALLGNALITALSVMSASLGQLIVWRFFLGFFTPGIAAAMAYISEESPVGSIGQTMAVYVTGTVMGGFLSRFIPGLVVTWFGWRTVFAVLAALILGTALAVWRILPLPVRFVPQRNAGVALRSMRMHLGNRDLLATYAVGFSVLFCQVATFTYVNFYLADRPFFFGPIALSSIFVVYFIGVVITPVAGHVMDRVGHFRALFGAVAMAAAGVLSTLVHYVPLIVLGLGLEASGVFVCQAVSVSHVGTAAAHARSSAAGLYVTTYYFGGFIGSVLPGLFWSRAGWPGTVATIICVQGLTVLIARMFWKDHR